MLIDGDELKGRTSTAAYVTASTKRTRATRNQAIVPILFNSQFPIPNYQIELFDAAGWKPPRELGIGRWGVSPVHQLIERFADRPHRDEFQT
jgi:hypothetical protein